MFDHTHNVRPHSREFIEARVLRLLMDTCCHQAQASQRTSLSSGKSCIGGSSARVMAVVVGVFNIASKAATWTQKSNSAEFLVSACLPLPPPAGSVPTCKARSYHIPALILRISRGNSHHNSSATYFRQFSGDLSIKLSLLSQPSPILQTHSYAHRPSCTRHHPRFRPRIAAAALMNRPAWSFVVPLAAELHAAWPAETRMSAGMEDGAEIDHVRSTRRFHLAAYALLCSWFDCTCAGRH